MWLDEHPELPRLVNTSNLVYEVLVIPSKVHAKDHSEHHSRPPSKGALDIAVVLLHGVEACTGGPQNGSPVRSVLAPRSP